MKCYIIYHFADKEIVKEKVKYLQLHCHDFDAIFYPETPMEEWRKLALKKIKQADCAIYFVGKESHTRPSVNWELEQFIRLGKPIYALKLDSSNLYNDILFRKSSFGNVESIDKSKNMHSKEVDIDKLSKIINNNLELDISEEVVYNADMNEETLIEQYKAYLQTSEDVVARRQSVSNFYISVNSTLLSVLSTVIAVLNGLGKDYSILVTVIGCFFIPILGVTLCLNWRRIICSYGQLNSAKMKVISAIEKKLPFNIYDVEWKVQTDKLGKKKYVSFTNIEKVIPLLFTIIYVIIFLVAIVLSILFL